MTTRAAIDDLVASVICGEDAANATKLGKLVVGALIGRGLLIVDDRPPVVMGERTAIGMLMPMEYEDRRTRVPKCQHSAQSWYASADGMGCDDCDAEAKAKR